MTIIGYVGDQGVVLFANGYRQVSNESYIALLYTAVSCYHNRAAASHID